MLVNDHDLGMRAPTPQDWGFPEKPTPQQLGCWENQELFLRLYARSGKVIKSVEMIGITRQALYKWQNADRFGFNERLEIAHQAYVERLEAELDRFIEESPHNTQIARIFRLKAEWPEKYREDIKPANNDASRELLDRVTAMAAKEVEERKRLEGEYRDLGEKEQR
jgi:hypothetical protein